MAGPWAMPWGRRLYPSQAKKADVCGFAYDDVYHPTDVFGSVPWPRTCGFSLYSPGVNPNGWAQKNPQDFSFCSETLFMNRCLKMQWLCVRLGQTNECERTADN